MKTKILVLLLLISGFGYSATIESAQDGNWGTNSTWIGGEIPKVGDVILINHTVTVTAIGNVDVSGSVHIEIYGQLYFSNKVTIDFATGTTISLHSSSALDGHNKHSEILVDGILQWDNDVGFASTNTAITDYTGTLPIELLEYEIKSNKLYFTTASQLDVDRFEIELYNEDLFQIGLLYADPCNCNQLMVYNVPIEDANVKYVRLVEYDYNGDVVKFEYLAINSKVEINIFEENVYYTMDGKMIQSSYDQLKPGVYIHKGKKLVKVDSY